MASASRVAVTQDLDLAEVDRVRTALTAAVPQAAAGPRRVVLDLTECAFVDVVGYRMLHDVGRTAALSGAALEVVGVRAPVLRVLAILDGLLAGGVCARFTTDAARSGASAAS